MVRVITDQEFEPLQEMVLALQKRIEELEKRENEWISVKEAEKRTGKNRKTLLKESKMPGTLLDTKIEGKRTRLYSANSIVNYNNRKIIKLRKQERLEHPLLIAS